MQLERCDGISDFASFTMRSIDEIISDKFIETALDSFSNLNCIEEYKELGITECSRTNETVLRVKYECLCFCACIASYNSDQFFKKNKGWASHGALPMYRRRFDLSILDTLLKLCKKQDMIQFRETINSFKSNDIVIEEPEYHIEYKRGDFLDPIDHYYDYCLAYLERAEDKTEGKADAYTMRYIHKVEYVSDTGSDNDLYLDLLGESIGTLFCRYILRFPRKAKNTSGGAEKNPFLGLLGESIGPLLYQQNCVPINQSLGRVMGGRLVGITLKVMKDLFNDELDLNRLKVPVACSP